VVKGLQDGPCFAALFDNATVIDNAGIGREVVGAAKALAEENEGIGAILMTCSDIPPYAAAVQEATGLPVFDYVSMIRWLHDAVAQRVYRGIL
jgi:hypothetical protein